eukprot:GHVS01036495.1.p1 GENE.GHVS01036495.1~~GHVS01036495.1.p1  ORF type:complete len:146 (+),score=3.62 GHVS01036495.1:163-600(+)
MGLKCFVCGPLAALVICLITACLADTSLRSPVRQLVEGSDEDRNLTRINVTKVETKDWLSVLGSFFVKVEKYSEVDELTVSLEDNKICWHEKDGSAIYMTKEVLKECVYTVNSYECCERRKKRLGQSRIKNVFQECVSRNCSLLQ